ncbi:EboA domain-containing protein [Zobellia sp. 1_MG-2023]|uniref:EboA domain-containing protein n=1 Tax=Zobellia sp. 1_MG-2023 TaxID=3062626 RepID=UPI0026E26FF2|nr:EboA domain-containing protein [Zobellia sp. 1_MG-2023]MDO6820445.1 EboA domain-containing protein [Zobellia sp. 1_MG-2023]
MELTKIDQKLQSLLSTNLDSETNSWLQQKLEQIIGSSSTKDLYMTYSLLASKIDSGTILKLSEDTDAVTQYLKTQKATTLQVARIYLLIKVLYANEDFFVPKVANLIQVADIGELETFLKFLILLPNAENYKQTAVEALRTNIATIFEAISMRNPYPAKYFNDQQWNQMFLKAAFMQLDLSNILSIDERANKDLARIISDYAHERWAASREIEPLFWRPVTGFLDDNLLKDMERLFASGNPVENKVAALCCYNSEASKAKELLDKYPEIKTQVERKTITWKNIKD